MAKKNKLEGTVFGGVTEDVILIPNKSKTAQDVMHFLEAAGFTGIMTADGNVFLKVTGEELTNMIPNLFRAFAWEVEHSATVVLIPPDPPREVREGQTWFQRLITQ